MTLPKPFVWLILISILFTACVPTEGTPSATQVKEITPSAAAPLPTTPPPTALPSVTPTQAGVPTPTSGSAWIEVNPTSVNPGDKVTITGYLPGGPTQAGAQDNQALLHANVCWMGCLAGLVIQGQSVEWSAENAGQFTLQFTTPSIPWLSNNGPQPLTSGDYLVGVQCLGADLSGCAQREALASASLHVDTASPRSCPEKECARLTLNPGQGTPGTLVQVQGWAPLDEIIGTLAFGYSLVLLPSGSPDQPVEIGSIDQDIDGNLSGQFQVPQSIPSFGELNPGEYLIYLQAARPKNASPILLAATPFQVNPALAWKDLSLPLPVGFDPSADISRPEVVVDPSHPQRLAACTPGGINLSEDGGKNWTLISTAGVEQAAAATPYSLFKPDSGAAACATVTLDPTHSQSFYTVFRTFREDIGAPPVYFMGFISADAGLSWAPVAPPSPAQVENFGGFWETPTAVQALFSPINSQPEQVSAPTVLSTSDGGKTWSEASLTCPAAGPCVRWGAIPGSISGMGAQAPQVIFYSADRGKTWVNSNLSVELRMQGPHELISFSESTAVLISGGADYPFLLTRDGGQTWKAVGLPLPSDAQGNVLSGLQMLPDGSLIAQPEPTKPWVRLSPRSQTWCPLVNANLPTDGPALIRGIGNNLWWVPTSGAQPQSQPLGTLRCGP